jgi:transposase
VRLNALQLTELESAVSVGYDGSVSSRAQMVLWWNDGISAADIARRAGTTKPTVYKWVGRYLQGGLEALESLKSTGRPASVPAEVRGRIVALTKVPPPPETGLTHWSSYEMSKYLKKHGGVSVSHSFIAQLWRGHNLEPHRQGTFKLSKDPEFSAKVVDIVGLYLDPPAGAVVLCFDEKTQVQALQRTQPLLPVAFGKTEKRTHGYVRHGTTNLFAALDTLTGKVIGRCFTRKRTGEFLRFMNQVVRAYSGKPQIHVVLDNLSTHDNDGVAAWLRRHPHVHFHFTPKGSSWVNQVETWFGVITRQAIRRGSFNSLAELIKTVSTYITHWNEDTAPFEWTATADEIIAKVALLDQDYRKLVANNLK